MKRLERTSCETNPVESLADALRAFVEDCDVLQTILAEFSEEADTLFAYALRAAMYRPVRPGGDNHPPISLYEIGVVYVPDGAGKYGVNNRKLKSALRHRENYVRALFVQEDGILPHLCEILLGFLEEEQHEFIQVAAMRFSNECRRQTAMWT